MFEALSDKLQGVFSRLGSKGTITDQDLDAAMREVRLALLEADVNFKVVKDFVAHIKERSVGAEVHKALKPHEQILGFVHEELIETLGKEAQHLNRAPQSPTVVMLVGLQGSGKTTMASKLAYYLRGRGDKVLLVACDVYRPAAVEQLKTLGRQIDIPVYDEGVKVKPLQIARNALVEARRLGSTVVILDTAGRLHIDQDMMDEVSELRRELKPNDVLFVADAMAGQDAVRAAEEFHKAVGVTGMVLTKMDGDARGGAALSIRHVVGVPVKFVGVGEKPEALEAFYPDRMAQRILGMGDIQTLIDKAKATIGDEDVKGLEKKMKAGQFDLEDFIDQLQRVKKMGPLGQLVGMLPGFGQIKKQLAVDEMDDSFFKQVEAIIYAMTPEERRRPEIINGARRRRIARGSGTQPQDVNQLLKQFDEAKKIMKVMTNTKGRGAAGMFGMFR